MATAHDQNGLVGIPCPVTSLHVGDAVGDPLGTRGLAMRWQAPRPQGIRLSPGARGVDDSAGLILVCRTIGRFDPEDEGLRVATEGFHFIHVLAANSKDAGPQAQVRRHARQGGEWGQQASREGRDAPGAGRH
jgi:hypothetical protein